MDKLDDAEILAQIPAAREREREAIRTEPRASRARYDRTTGRIEVELTNGCAFAFPPELADALQGAEAADLADVSVELGGEGLHWERLDADLLVPDLMRGVFGSERWMREIGRTLGRARSDAKARASRVNGRKGGRPRKG